MPARKVPVHYRLAADEELPHSVQVEVDGLDPAREYLSRFKAGAELGRVGRTLTAPPANADVAHLALAFVSCQNYPPATAPPTGTSPRRTWPSSRTSATASTRALRRARSAALTCRRRRSSH